MNRTQIIWHFWKIHTRFILAVFQHFYGERTDGTHTRNIRLWAFGFQFDDLFCCLCFSWWAFSFWGKNQLPSIWIWNQWTNNLRLIMMAFNAIERNFWISFGSSYRQTHLFYNLINEFFSPIYSWYLSRPKIDLPITSDAWGVYSIRMYAFHCMIDGNE